ncbi:hypothetical protein BC828DRAFT_236586 [Blastocladiella britannica]|nr:hypothetical protein BC828DRAFT_236586 [Blastocladiella britannica]
MPSTIVHLIQGISTPRSRMQRDPRITRPLRQNSFDLMQRRWHIGSSGASGDYRRRRWQRTRAMTATRASRTCTGPTLCWKCTRAWPMTRSRVRYLLRRPLSPCPMESVITGRSNAIKRGLCGFHGSTTHPADSRTLDKTEIMHSVPFEPSQDATVRNLRARLATW